MKKNSLPKPPRAVKAEPRRAILIRRERNLRRRVSTAAVRRAVLRTLESEAFRKACSISIVLAADETVARLNARYRGIARPTDVLSFSANVVDPHTRLLHLGDIIIALPCAARQAAARQATLESEILLLAVHGTLHLLGHDHAQATAKRRMWRAQKLILQELNRIA
jgi:probable rRNA maturation factor